MEKQKKTEHVEKKEKRRRIIHTQKSYLTAGVIMLVAVIAMAGAYQREKKNAENAQNEAVALAENDWVEPETDTTSTGDETQEPWRHRHRNHRFPTISAHRLIQQGSHRQIRYREAPIRQR